MAERDSKELITGAIRRWREHPASMVRELFGVEPDAWQEEVLELFPHNQRLAMKAPIDVDSRIWTPDGERRWGDIQPGDKLFAEDGSITTVLSRTKTVIGPMYRVHFRDGTSLRVTADHEWDIQTSGDRKKGRRRTVSTREMMGMTIRQGKAGQRVISIPTQEPVQFPPADLPVDPYVLGLWLGDGVANEARLICPDHAIRRELRLRGQVISESERVTKRIGLLGIAGDLRATGVMHCRSYEKTIPYAYKMGSVTQRLDLLRGLMDSDGTCAKNGHCYLASSSLDMINDFMSLARSLGYVATKMGPYRINDGENRDSYRAVICGPICPFGADTKKKQRWRAPARGKATRFIDRIEADGQGAAMCVEIDHPSHCFQATDFIVTHNCKGPGKTTVLAWICWNFLLTRPHPKIPATSISGDNLADGLWVEMAKWQNTSELLKQSFTWTKTRIFSNDHPETWFMTARTWSRSAASDQQANTLAGLHADYIMFVLDEAGGIPDAVMAAAEAALSTGKEMHIVIAGNPTHLEGPLYRACTTEAKLWKVIEITGDPDDPKRSPRISVDWARAQIEKYGRDNPWVLVNVFGKFPPSSINSLIGPDAVSEAMKRVYNDYQIGRVPTILGVDVARYGSASSVIFPRRGIQMFTPKKVRNIDSVQGAALVSQMWGDVGAQAAFVDDTGGFGAGWIDQLRVLGRQPIGVHFAAEAQKKERYANKRTEMYFDFTQWIKEGGALPQVPELLAALPVTTYTFTKDGRMLLEPKELIEAKIGYSPDDADAGALTFAFPVAFQEVKAGSHSPGVAKQEWNPFQDRMGRGGIGNAVADSYDNDYDPLGRK